jgi:hypothetical protein
MTMTKTRMVPSVVIPDTTHARHDQATAQIRPVETYG